MAYNNRLDDDVMDDGSTEHTAVAIPEENESTMNDEFATLLYPMMILCLPIWTQMKKST